jgi:hypothetical protein
LAFLQVFELHSQIILQRDFVLERRGLLRIGLALFIADTLADFHLRTKLICKRAVAGNLGIRHGDALAFDIDDIDTVEMRVRIGAATFTSGSILVFGVGSARDDTANSVDAHAWFRIEGANSTTQVYVETDDAVRDNDDIATGLTLGTTYRRFVIDFTGGKSNVKFYMDDANGNLTRVAASTTFDMSGYTAGLQPIVQLQKAANANADACRVDYIKIVGKRV